MLRYDNAAGDTLSDQSDHQGNRKGTMSDVTVIIGSLGWSPPGDSSVTRGPFHGDLTSHQGSHPATTVSIDILGSCSVSLLVPPCCCLSPQVPDAAPGVTQLVLLPTAGQSFKTVAAALRSNTCSQCLITLVLQRQQRQPAEVEQE